MSSGAISLKTGRGRRVLNCAEGAHRIAQTQLGEAKMAVFATDDWVRLKRLHCGCRYGKIVRIDGDVTFVQTDATKELACMDHEVTLLHEQTPPVNYFPMRKLLPYGRYNCDDSYVLFNRDYEPLYRLSSDGSCSPCEPTEYVEHTSEEWFYREDTPPWKSRKVFEACVAKLPATSPSYSRRSSIWRLRGFWDLGAHGFVRLFHRLTTDTFANALEG